MVPALTWRRIHRSPRSPPISREKSLGDRGRVLFASIGGKGAAGDRPCIEMGSRRTHEQSAVAAARAAYVAGFQATSNLEAGRRHALYRQLAGITMPSDGS